MGYRLNHHDEPVFMAVPEPMLTEFGIRLESCVAITLDMTRCLKKGLPDSNG